MTTTTGAPWNLVYQEYSDTADISAAVKDLADSADTAVQSLYDQQAIGVAKPAGRTATTTAQSIPNNLNTQLTWPAGSQSFDNDNMIDNTGATSGITFNHTGIYVVSLRVSFALTASGGGVRQIDINHSTLGLVARNSQLGTVSDFASPFITAVIPIYVAGQFVIFRALQTSSVALNVGTRYAQAFRLSTL